MSNQSHNKTETIEKFLKEASRSLENLKNELADESRPLPASARYVEQRIRTLRDQLDSISSKMLAYKLHRLAESKMLRSVSELAKEQHPPPPAPAGKTKSNSEKRAERNSKTQQQYESSTFKCKSDLDNCLACSVSTIDKALCYALFIRCAVKG